MGSNPTRGAAGAATSAGPSGSKVNSAGSNGAGAVDSAAGTVGAGVDSGPLAAGVEPLGLVADEADPGRLIAEAEAAAAGAPVDALVDGPPLDPNGQWSALTPPLVEVVCGVVLPAWEIRKEEQAPVSEALGACLEQLFPGGIEGKYACWVRLIFACGAITVSRVHQHGKLPPLFFPKSTPKPTPPAETVTAVAA